jgi:hypothetical protein
MKKTAFVFSLLFVFAIHHSIAQDVVLDQKPDEGLKSRFGPNKDYFMQFTMGFGTLIGASGKNLSYNDLRSNDLRAGIKFKRKISGLLSFWLEPEYHYAAYNINQSGPKITDTLFRASIPTKHEKERFATEGILVNGFFRFNFDPKRGNFMGYYLDLGAGVDFILDPEYLAIDKEPNGSTLRSSYSNIPYMNTIGYNATAKIGINWLAFTFNYRLTSLFKSRYNIPEPPAITVGIEVNPYSH